MKMRGTEACLSFAISVLRMIESSRSSLGNSFLVANQRDCQLRRTARRKPIGLVFWPMVVNYSELPSERMMRMWDIFLRRGIAVPRAPALKRLRTGPQSMVALFTVSESAERLLLFSAFAMALLSVLTMRRADLRGMSVKYSTAS